MIAQLASRVDLNVVLSSVRGLLSISIQVVALCVTVLVANRRVADFAAQMIFLLKSAMCALISTLQSTQNLSSSTLTLEEDCFV